MKNIILTAIAGAFLTFSWLATANAADGFAARIAADHPGLTGGNTVNPLARPDNSSSSLQSKIMQDHPGTTGGRTVEPLANLDFGSIQNRIRLQ